MALKPLHDRVLVRRVESDEKTAGGLIIPDSAKKPAEGLVVAAGEGARKDNGELIAMAVKEGDKILFGKWSGTEVTIDGEELLIMKESDVLGILSKSRYSEILDRQGKALWLLRTSNLTQMLATACYAA